MTIDDANRYLRLCEMHEANSDPLLVVRVVDLRLMLDAWCSRQIRGNRARVKALRGKQLESV
jgi:hypothetical protein